MYDLQQDWKSFVFVCVVNILNLIDYPNNSHENTPYPTILHYFEFYTVFEFLGHNIFDFFLGFSLQFEIFRDVVYLLGNSRRTCVIWDRDGIYGDGSFFVGILAVFGILKKFFFNFVQLLLVSLLFAVLYVFLNKIQIKLGHYPEHFLLCAIVIIWWLFWRVWKLDWCYWFYHLLLFYLSYQWRQISARNWRVAPISYFQTGVISKANIIIIHFLAFFIFSDLFQNI